MVPKVETESSSSSGTNCIGTGEDRGINTFVASDDGAGCGADVS